MKVLAREKHQQEITPPVYPRYIIPTTAAHSSAKLLAVATTAPLLELDDGAVEPLVLVAPDEVVAAADDDVAAAEELRVAELKVEFLWRAVPVAALPLAPAPVPTAPVPTAPVPTAPVPTIAVAVALTLTTAVVVVFLLDEPEPPTTTPPDDGEVGIVAAEVVDETDAEALEDPDAV